MHFSKLFLLATAMPLALGAQQTTDSASKPAAPPPPPAGPQISGTVFANYMYKTGQSGAGANSFNFERAYITLKEKLSDRTSVRLTTDVFASNVSGATGYVVRLKYGYLQYDYLKGSDWSAVARGGLLHTAVIDHEENFWPRWIATTPTDMLGYFSSADFGVATLISMPNKMGEVYAVVSNGSGYKTTTDADRYKDYQGRVTLTPFASSSTGLLKTLDLSGWYYKGALAGAIATTKATDRDRYGAFVGIRDPHLTIGLNYSQRKDEGQSSPTTDTTLTGRVMSAYTLIRPFQLMNADAMPLGVVLRYDQVKPNTSVSNQYSVYIAGLTYDLSKNASLSLDYQEESSNTGVAPTGSTLFLGAPKAVYMHMVINY